MSFQIQNISTGGGADILFGGVDSNSVVRGEYAWAYNNSQWVTSSASFGPPQNLTPAPRFGGSMAYNSTGEYVLLVGGCSPDPSGGCGPLSARADTWEFENGSWTPICYGCGPSARWDAGLTYDPAAGLFVLYGGCSAMHDTCSSVLGDTWEFWGRHWVLTSPLHPPPSRGDMMLVWDPVNSAVVMYGGEGCGGLPSVCDDTWQFVTGSPPSWTRLLTSSPLGYRFGAAAAYDPLLHQIILFGGHGLGTGVDGDTWGFTAPSSWVNLGATGGPQGAFDAELAFDPINGSMILHGGADTGGGPISGTWWFGNGAWHALTLYQPVGPLASWSAAIVYDPAAGPAGELLVFGGSLGPDSLGPYPTPGGLAPGGGSLFDLIANPPPPYLGVFPGGYRDWLSGYS